MLTILLIYLQVGDRQVGIIYPPVTSVSVELSESNDINTMYSVLYYSTDSDNGRLFSIR